MKVVVAFMLLAGAVAAALVPASAAPSDAHAVFRRHCSQCSQEDFCEFAYPGTPAGSVACVTYRSASHLYRRYAGSFTQCTGGSDCCSGLITNKPNRESAAACAASCTAESGCKYFSFLEDNGNPANNQCALYSSCDSFNAPSGPIVAYAMDQNACPTTVGCG
ncbi:hypothetical protein DFJ74DRAFT_686646 [Hyaloraphidium curvatum]|nr:hypothetical protein DFJ74DRAFT_686646 [Hyaloraphidium curvatum]